MKEAKRRAVYISDNNDTTYKDFYPTPQALIDRMLAGIEWYRVASVLEPSAGKGDLVDGVVSVIEKQYRYAGNVMPEIECIEINQDLQNVLKGKGYRVVHDNFLNYVTFRRYGLILMNPPFSDGDKHLLKALELQEKGGSIVCLLNAETLRNPYSVTRQDLKRKLDEYNASIEYIEKAFSSAERKTDVDVALVKVYIPEQSGGSVILEHLEKAKEQEKRESSKYQETRVAPNDLIEAVVKQYQYEARAGCQLIQDARALGDVVKFDFDEESTAGILSLVINKYKKEEATENLFIKELRYKYWKTLFQSDKFSGIFTSNLQDKYMARLDELKDYEFSYHNIYQLRIDLNKQMVQGVEDAIIKLFDELSYKHSYHEGSKNIHYYNGWKTNKAYKINHKVIIRLDGWGYWSYKPNRYQVVDKLSDIEKVFNYLSGNVKDESNMRDILTKANDDTQTKNIELDYFKVTFYKKGTCHITFTNLKLLKKFNLYGSQRKGWLPPTYGRAAYNDMTQEEQTVVDSFEGRKEYEETVKDVEFYLPEGPVLMLQEETVI